MELCLTLPARLSSILPHLPRLAQPLLRALKSSSSELQLLGLRTLEFWVDSLNPDFLDPCIAEVESDLMLALWALLKPQQSGAPFGAKALQMLGKLGGRSRGFLREPLELEAKSNPEHGLRLILTFKPETSFLVPLDRCIALMKTILAAPPVPNLKGAEALVEHRKHALAFLRACLASVLNVAGGAARAVLLAASASAAASSAAASCPRANATRFAHRESTAMTQRVMPAKSTVIGTARAPPAAARDAPTRTRSSVTTSFEAAASASSRASEAGRAAHAPEPASEYEARSHLRSAS